MSVYVISPEAAARIATAIKLTTAVARLALGSIALPAPAMDDRVKAVDQAIKDCALGCKDDAIRKLFKVLHPELAALPTPGPAVAAEGILSKLPKLGVAVVVTNAEGTDYVQGQVVLLVHNGRAGRMNSDAGWDLGSAYPVNAEAWAEGEANRVRLATDAEIDTLAARFAGRRFSDAFDTSKLVLELAKGRVIPVGHSAPVDEVTV